MEFENKTAESLEESENKENQDAEKFRKQLIIKSYSLVFFWPRLIGQDCWISASFFCFALLWTKTKEPGQYPAILTSCQVNNVHITA